MFASMSWMAPVAGILHADLDAFYASVEQLLDPTLQGKPIAVGGGVVLAASYEAKAFGVQAGMAGWRARQLCPRLRFVGGHFREYQRLGDEVMDVLHDFTPLVERISIDEAFLDVRGSVHLFGSPASIATAIRRRVRDEIGLALSVGVATTKHLAKVASQVAKPDGLVVVEAGRERAFLDPLPVELLWGVGPVTQEKLAGRGIRTIGQLAAASGDHLERLLGHAAGSKLGALAVNDDPRRLETSRRAHSVGAQSALGRRTATVALLRAVLGHLADHPSERDITLLAVSVSNVRDEPALQLELPLGLADQRERPGAPAGAARWAIDRAVDTVRDRFGRDAVGYAAVTFSDVRSVPDAFRELAEAHP